jgi:hypothetical protein
MGCPSIFLALLARSTYARRIAKVGTINLFYPFGRLYIFVFGLAARLIVIDSVTELTV